MRALEMTGDQITREPDLWKAGAMVDPVREGSPMRRLCLFTIALLLGVLLCSGTALAASPHGTGHFIAANPMTTARGYFTATELLNGNVLVAGGYDGIFGPPPFFGDAEIYHWRTGIWSCLLYTSPSPRD